MIGLVLAVTTFVGVCLPLVWLTQRARVLNRTVAEQTAALQAERDALCTANDRLRATNQQLRARNEELGNAKAALARTHAHLLSVFDELPLGVVAVNPRCAVLFANERARRLITTRRTGRNASETDTGNGQAVVTGKPLSDLLGVEPETMAEIESQIVAPHAGARITAVVQAAGARHWTDIEIRVDPRDRRNRLLYLHEVTESYAIKKGLTTDSSEGPAGLLLGTSMVMRTLRQEVLRLSAYDATLLIQGETGTGKELVARAVHAASRRKDGPFVAINCAGLAESLLASQLFGHRRGAFTGAVQDHVGLFEAAQGGTLLLDEIGDMPLAVQAHLLRVLQEREILRLGESKPRPIDVRVVAATHRNLEHAVKDGSFREDLLYRIRVLRLTISPLRERLEDVPLLATTFLQQFAAIHGKTLEIGRPAMERLVAHSWPGNVRELKGAIEAAVVKTVGPVIRLTDLPSELLVDASHAAAPHVEAGRQALIETLRRTGGNRTVTARLLGVSRATLYRRLAAVEETAASRSVSRLRRSATAADTADVSLAEPAGVSRASRERDTSR